MFYCHGTHSSRRVLRFFSLHSARVTCFELTCRPAVITFIHSYIHTYIHTSTCTDSNGSLDFCASRECRLHPVLCMRHVFYHKCVVGLSSRLRRQGPSLKVDMVKSRLRFKQYGQGYGHGNKYPVTVTMTVTVVVTSKGTPYNCPRAGHSRPLSRSYFTVTVTVTVYLF